MDDVNNNISNGCGDVASPDNELITSFGSEPIIKIYHENFQPGITVNNGSAHIIIYKIVSDTCKWQTYLGACVINIR